MQNQGTDHKFFFTYMPDKVLKNPSMWRTKNNFATFFFDASLSLCTRKKRWMMLGATAEEKNY